MLQTKGANLLRQIEFMAVVDRPHRFGAADEQRRGTCAVAGLAGSLLLVELLLGLVYFTAGQNLVGSGATLCELPDHDALDQIGARFQSEDLVVQLDLAL